MNKKACTTMWITGFTLCAVLHAGSGWSSTPDLQFADSKKLLGTVFELQGVGKKSVFFVNAFEVGYYQEKHKATRDPLDNVAKHIEVRYFVDIPGNKLFNFNISVMQDNYSEEELLAIADEIAALKEYYIDLKKGDRYELTYIPEVGTRFVHNGNLKGIIKGERFAEILFAVWLGEKPFDQKIKEQILSLRNRAAEEKLTLLDT